MKNITKVLGILFFSVYTNSFCFGQNEKEYLNIIGCQQTVKYTSVNKKVTYPSWVKMIYRFYCDGKYEMIILNGSTNKKKEQNGIFKFVKNSITLIPDGGDSITDKVSFTDSSNLQWNVVLNNENGTFQLKRTLCADQFIKYFIEVLFTELY